MPAVRGRSAQSVCVKATRFGAALAALTIAFASLSPPPARADVPKDELVVHIFDVGQGSCVLIECPDGPPILDDCGHIGSGGDPTAAVVKIRDRLDDLRVAYPTPLQILISHPHVDHFSAMVDKVTGFPTDDVRRLYWAGPWDSFSVKAKAWIEGLAVRIDGAAHNGACVDGARVTCLAPNEHALETPRFSCGAAKVDLLTASALTYNKSLGAGRKVAKGTSPNGESAVLRIRYAGVSLVFPGDAEEVTQLYAVENAQALGAPLDPTTVLLLPHHGSGEVGSNDKVWAGAISPQLVVVSANIGGNYGHPNCDALSHFDTDPGTAMAPVSTPIDARCGDDKAHPNDHVVLHHRFIFTETNHDVTLRVSKTGDLTVTCDTAGVACAAASPTP